MKLKLVTKSEDMPVALESAKAAYRVLGNEEDEVITRTIESAVAKAEQITNRQLSTSEYEAYLDAFSSRVVLPRPPLVSVDKVSYIDTDGTVKEWTDYVVDDAVEPAVIHFGSTPNDVRSTGVNNVIIRFTCGYESIPSPIASWILAYGATLFESRQFREVGVSGSVDFTKFMNHLLDSYRIIPV
jgi:uncharacterized phiE125 gp8 family phage protein